MSDVTSDVTNVTTLAGGNPPDNTAQLNNIAKNVEAMSADMKQLVALMGGNTGYSQTNYLNFQAQYHSTYGYKGKGYGNSTTTVTPGNVHNIINQGAAQWNAKQFKHVQDSFLDEFEKAIWEGFFGNDLKARIKAGVDKMLKDALDTNIDNVAKVLGIEFNNLSGSMGKVLGKVAMNAFKGSPFGQQLTNATQDFVSKAGDIMINRGTQFLTLLDETGSLQTAAAGAFSGTLTELSVAGNGLVTVIGAWAPEIAAAAAIVIIAFKALDTVTESLKLTIEAAKKVWDGLSKVANREQSSREQNVKLAEARMKSDYEVLVKQPFELLKEAAQSIYTSWNQNLTTVAATQGYDKADVQDLMSAFAQRLRDEGLSNYISGSDMFDNLSKVLASGMSGAIAEEFAYQATVLGKAIPTQDFFGYASTYASIASNAARAGKSQQEAIEAANESLQSFANGLLYASRELTGGFTTGLQNGATLYEEAAKIAQAARSDNLSNITGALLAVQSYVGAVAPDLATNLTSTLYKTLTGGNSSDIVALRSLANVNASNTEFLREFANNPQTIFATMFENLANMYSESSDAYMEKAEGYAQLFGLTAETFQRIDFADLASAIRGMNMTSDSLVDNMKLLREGQTTTTAEQLKAQQINQYMIEEGLAYVIDNEAAQLIQQHMWDEQMQRELMEATYSVDLTGSAMEALEMIHHAVNNILNFLNPLAYLKKLGNIVSTVGEAAAQEADVRQLLELGKVGNGNTKSLYQLTTRGQDLNLTKSLVELMGGNSLYDTASQLTKNWNKITSPYYTFVDTLANGASMNAAILQTFSNSGTSGFGKSGAANSSYNWGSISKSRAALANAVLKTTGQTKAASPNLSTVATPSGTSAASSSASVVKQSIDRMLEDSYLVDQFVKKGKSYEDWASTASKYGISDLQSALSTAGYSEADVIKYFQDKEAQEGLNEQQSIREEEKTFRDKGINFWETTFPAFRESLFGYVDELEPNQATMIENQTTMIANQATMIVNQGTMITNQEVMIEKLGSIISNQESWHTYFQNTWTPNWNELFEKVTIDKGWDGYFKHYFNDQWVTLGWNAFFNTGKDAGVFNKLYTEFHDRFSMAVYENASTGYTWNDVTAVKEEKKASERGDVVYALAEMLTKNALDLTDPTRQTNALLAQILIVVEAIKNQTDEAGGGTGASSLAESLSALALGLTGNSSTTNTNSTVQ